MSAGFVPSPFGRGIPYGIFPGPRNQKSFQVKRDVGFSCCVPAMPTRMCTLVLSGSLWFSLALSPLLPSLVSSGSVVDFLWPSMLLGFAAGIICLLLLVVAVICPSPCQPFVGLCRFVYGTLPLLLTAGAMTRRFDYP